MYKVDNAIIMAAGTSSRFAPLSYELPKALITVKGEVLIERQIKQLQMAGIKKIVIVTGYKANKFEYLKDKFGVELIYNSDYLTRNNNSSIYVARNCLRNSYICSADNYFTVNPFTTEVDDSYYAAQYATGPTKEWCISTDNQGYIDSVQIGGDDSWFMIGHTFWSREFSNLFLNILKREYDKPETKQKLWEDLYIEHLDILKMKIKKYSKDEIIEFDSLEELRKFDKIYIEDSHSKILRDISTKLGIKQGEICGIETIKNCTNEAIGFNFCVGDNKYNYTYTTQRINAI